MIINIIYINESLLYEYNPNSNYYNDICNINTTKYGTDITLYDRKDEYNKNNMFICPNNCKYINYDVNNKYVKCQCEPKNGISLDKTKLINILINKKTTINLKILKCHKKLFSKIGLIKNSANYIIFLIIVLYIASGVYFFAKGQKIFFKQFEEIYNTKKIEIENKLRKDLNNEEQSKGDISEFSASIKKLYKSNSNRNIFKFESRNNINSTKSNSITKDISNKIIIKENDIIEAQKQKYYEEYEINNFSYKKALTNDKRSFCQLYLSLLKMNHILIFSFNPQKDYNPYIIKICLFFFVFAIYMFVNTLFFNDSMLHKIYEDKGNFNFSFAITRIIYSIIICSIINVIINKLYLTQQNILEIKNENNIIIFNFRLINIIKCLTIKLLLFFIINLICLIFFWFYLSCFCFIYQNTQTYLFIVILISYSISLIYPFFIYFISCIFRFSALKSSGMCLYKTSQLLQLF